MQKYKAFPGGATPSKRVAACSIFVNNGVDCARRFFNGWPERAIHVVLVSRKSELLPADPASDEVSDTWSDKTQMWPLSELRREAAAVPCVGPVGITPIAANSDSPRPTTACDSKRDQARKIAKQRQNQEGREARETAHRRRRISAFPSRQEMTLAGFAID